MLSKTARLFLYVAGVLLLATAAAKFIGSFGGARVLNSADPITGLSFRALFRIAGAVELFVALYCLLGRKVKFQAGLVAWLAGVGTAGKLVRCAAGEASRSVSADIGTVFP